MNDSPLSTKVLFIDTEFLGHPKGAALARAQVLGVMRHIEQLIIHGGDEHLDIPSDTENLCGMRAHLAALIDEDLPSAYQTSTQLMHLMYRPGNTVVAPFESCPEPHGGAALH